MRSLARALVLALAGSTAGCAHFAMSKRPVEVEHREVVAANGLRSEDLFVGTGPAAASADEVTFDYTVWLEDGTRVDSTLDRGVPLEVVLSSAPVRGLAEGIVGMKPNGRRRLVVPAALAYGSEGVDGMIPPGATLVFEVHLLEVGGVGAPTAPPASSEGAGAGRDG